MYELIQVGENTFYINAPANIGMYRFNNNEICLIDSGINDHMGKRILQTLSEKGWSLSMIINTHHHADHVGGNAYLVNHTRCQCFSSNVNATIITNPLINTSLVYGGYPIQSMLHPLLHSKSSPCKAIETANLPKGLEWERFDGHSLEMLGIKTADNIWFLGDAIIGEDSLKKNPISFIYDTKQYLDSLERISELDGTYFIPAHGQGVNNISSLVEINHQNIVSVLDHIMILCKSSIYFEKLLSKLCGIYKIEMNYNQYALYSSALRSYLSYLERINMIQFSLDENHFNIKLINY